MQVIDLLYFFHTDLCLFTYFRFVAVQFISAHVLEQQILALLCNHLLHITSHDFRIDI